MAIDLNNKNQFPPMVHWFTPRVLLDSARRAIISGLFGSYADRRLIHAALDKTDIVKGCDYVGKIASNTNGEMWFDYVADLGDGFESTYAIAYLLGQKELKCDEYKLPRGQLLVMGGDEVYPIADKKEYQRRMENPYRYAFPNSEINGTDHPPLFLIPGNHDWYDGLTLFLAKFCRGKEESLGSWRMHQSRSYFAIKLPDNWWIWWLDTQLGEDIDQPQEDYFVKIATENLSNETKKIILCASVPTWLKVESEDRGESNKFYRGIDHIASLVIKKYWSNAKIYAVISGDQHHYSRYFSDKSGTNFITSGGGGAFLHPTHHLKDKIHIIWTKVSQDLHLAMKDGIDVCFPNRNVSRKLSLGNWKFPFINWSFCLVTLGGFYSFAALLMTMWRKDDASTLYSVEGFSWFINIVKSIVTSPIFIVILLLSTYIFILYVDKETTKKKIFGIAHGFTHLLLIVLLVSLLPPVNTWFNSLFIEKTILDWYPGSWSLILLMAEITVIGGFIGGFIWGLYLLIASYFFSLHYNDAFSAMRLNKYKNFLRVCLKGDTLTIYSIGLEKCLERKDWEVNQNATKNNQNEPVIVPKKELGQILIEDPIVIDGSKIAS